MIYRNLQRFAQNRTPLCFPLLARLSKTGGSFISALVLSTVYAAAAQAQSAQQAAEHYLTPLLEQYAQQQGWQGLRLNFQHQPSTLLNSQCPEAFEVSGANGDLLSRQRLSLSCPSQGSSLNLISQVQVLVQAVHASQNIERGSLLSHSNLQVRELELGRNQREFFSHISQLEGQEARRRIRSNQLLNPSLLKDARIISRGERLRIVANQEGISASTLGEALEDGRTGQVIRVRNVSSEKIIDALVLEAGVVTSTW